ncbi:MAG: HpcH/HpaI aldolase family protein [bacterium]
MLKNKLLQRQVCIGSWCQVGHPANAEILAKAGFDWIAADCEHGEFSEAEIAPFCRAVEAMGSTPLVRVKENAVLPIRRALDLGAAGVIVPLVNSAAEARRAVEAACYPPEGIRGFAWQRANAWGTRFNEYAREFKPVILVMIESRQAVENINNILNVDGIDGVFIGPYDMSGSYGVPGQTDHESVVNACKTVADACRQAGKAAGQHIVVPTKENVQQAIAQNYRILALGMDTDFLTKGAQEARGLVND